MTKSTKTIIIAAALTMLAAFPANSASIEEFQTEEDLYGKGLSHEESRKDQEGIDELYPRPVQTGKRQGGQMEHHPRSEEVRIGTIQRHPADASCR